MVYRQPDGEDGMAVGLRQGGPVMIVSDNEARRPEQRQRNGKPGWTALHSWIFLAIVALGLTLVAIQNRYFYLSPLGLGKAYRIDKLFGGIQEFEPVKGSWIKADIPSGPSGPPPQAMSMMPPPSQALQMNQPGMMPPGAPSVSGSVPGMSPSPTLPQETESKESAPTEQTKETQTPAIVEQEIPETKSGAVASKPQKPVEISEGDRFKMFEAKFPGFGKQEFQLANDDLYPHWKKNIVKNGTWPQFLDTYADFVQWWKDSGSPSESGFKLWQDFLASRKR